MIDIQRCPSRTSLSRRNSLFSSFFLIFPPQPYFSKIKFLYLTVQQHHQNRSASSSFQDEMNKKKIRSKGPFLLYETTVHKKKHANFSHPNLNNPTFKKLIKRKPLVRLISNFLCMILASIC